MITYPLSNGTLLAVYNSSGKLLVFFDVTYVLRGISPKARQDLKVLLYSSQLHIYSATFVVDGRGRSSCVLDNNMAHQMRVCEPPFGRPIPGII